jgi:hypothetical protein
MFHPQHGALKIAYLLGALLAGAGLILLLMQTPRRFRRTLILVVTFLGGLMYALEFFWPVHPMPTANDPKAVGNFLTPLIVPFGQISPVIQGFAVGLGVINLIQIHGKRLVKRAPESINSLVFFAGMIAMFTVHVLQQAHPNAINKNLERLLFDGALQSLDATMFSIIAFYIVSAAYRAFRVRNVEATLLLVTAIIVMLGQIPVGIFLTSRLPPGAHIEAIRNWLLTKVSASAVRAISFGLGIGSLAVALRLWLGLERGSYFDNQG